MRGGREGLNKKEGCKKKERGFSKSQEQELHFIRIIQEPDSEKLVPVSLYPCLSVSLHLCIPVSLYLFIPVSLYPCFYVFLYPISMGVRYFSKGISPRATSQVTIFQVATSQMCNFPSDNFPKVWLGPLRRRSRQWGQSAAARMG